MARFVSLCLILCSLCLVPCAPARAVEGEPQAEGDARAESAKAQAQAADAVNAFAFDVYGLLSKEKGNVFFSPYSISSALAMAWAGADGRTAEEMAKALRFDASGAAAVHAGMKGLRERFASMPEELGVLAVANRLWLDGQETLLPAFSALVGENYGAGAELVDFENDAEAARGVINEWVEQETRGKIKDLLRGGDVMPDTRLVLTNAVYFNSAWRRAFDKASTKVEPFHTGKGEQKDVPMMKQTGVFPYGEISEAGLQLIKIPYKMPGFSLLILLPRENESFTQLDELEKKLTPEALSAWTAGMKNTMAALHLPKFKDERRYSLGDILQKLGMNLAFSGDADFSGMMEDARSDVKGNLHVNAVIHQTFIELDEEKTEAAAATAVTMMRTTSALPRNPTVEFRADHPFIYCLTDDASGAVLFMGRMAAP